MNRSKIAEMSCNPSIGGVGKGQLVKELDALGGEMGKNADYTGIQFKRLNTRKGSAVQSSRCQSDKKLYALRMQKVLSEQSDLDILEGEAKLFHVEQSEVRGLTVKAKDGSGSMYEIATGNIVITAGTFMKAVMHCGSDISEGGRFGEAPSKGLSDCLREMGFTINRLKTGTPPRLIAGSIDFLKMERQEGDVPPARFSFSRTEIPLPQVPCFLTYTNPETHEAIRQNLHRSPLYSGVIKGVGPRYCPSIEDKVVKFPEKTRHQLFFEPEALDSDWIYPNGISTSLPPDVQEAFIRQIPGCAEVKFARYGYAVEYDCIDPRQLKPTFESAHIAGLFLAGQVNGTSGYEEAGIQGLFAGINAGLRAQGRSAFTLSRAEAYLGVLVDDLTSQGVNEPYRMFTSRAEFRLSLREDNADMRLREYGRQIGLIGDDEYRHFTEKKRRLTSTRVFLGQKFLKPDNVSMAQYLKRPEVSLPDMLDMFHVELPEPLNAEELETLEVEVKYEGYIEMQRLEIERLKKMNTLGIPETFNYGDVAGLSVEVREKLGRTKPRTLGDASRISGVTPSALTALLFHLRQKGDTNAVATRTV
jgi:tRNA uridine 5-carboxymethylaminomethyl modification enzyme